MESKLKAHEKLQFEQKYSRHVDRFFAVYPTVEDHYRFMTRSSTMDFSSIYGDINALFFRRIFDELRNTDPNTVKILDYGCGMGSLAVYFARCGFPQVYGFDLSFTGVNFGMELAHQSSVNSQVFLQQMDGEHLAYPNDFFDFVIGKAVLHHTIKYTKSAAELHRVLKPGGKAYFKENLGNNPLLKLVRFYTMNVLSSDGDVNITTPMIQKFSQNFSACSVEAWHFLYVGKRLLWRNGRQALWRKKALQLLKLIDDMTIHRSGRLRSMFCGESIITLTK